MSTVQGRPLETNQGIVTSWLPLTTGWSAPPSCSSLFILEPGWLYDYGDNEPPTATGLLAWDPGYGILVEPAVRCHPDEVSSSWDLYKYKRGLHKEATNFAEATMTKLSLLPLTCPDAWSTVATFVKSGIGTQAMCCPPYVKSHHRNHSNKLINVLVRSYALSTSVLFSTGVEGDCVSLAGLNSVLSYASPIDFIPTTLSSPVAVISYVYTSTIVDFNYSVTAIPILGWNVQPTTSPSGNSTSSQTDSKTVTSFPTPTLSRSDGLSNGIKAGIGVAVAVSALIIITLFAWIVILKRRSRNMMVKMDAGDHRIGSDSQSNSNPSPELDNSQINELHHSNSNPLRELDDSQIHELHPSNLYELQSVSARAELAAASRRSRG